MFDSSLRHSLCLKSGESCNYFLSLSLSIVVLSGKQLSSYSFNASYAGWLIIFSPLNIYSNPLSFLIYTTSLFISPSSNLAESKKFQLLQHRKHIHTIVHPFRVPFKLQLAALQQDCIRKNC